MVECEVNNHLVILVDEEWKCADERILADLERAQAMWTKWERHGGMADPEFEAATWVMRHVAGKVLSPPPVDTNEYPPDARF